ncbi:MAG: DUF2975 domain-containing protein [Clostridiales Family XIII bacterium]|jgi:hypothetical protein|nr:DUF2975 domain-containing protein [Clostridiales Family XIII bacterium]
MLSLICTKVIIVIVILCVVILVATLISPALFDGLYGDSTLFTTNQIRLGIPLLIVASAPALVALFCLHRLLSHIRAEEVFTAKNIRLLRAISWACFAASIVFFVGFFACIPLVGIQPSFFVVGAFAGFAGLIMRVVKNVIDAARELKDENDFTI